MGRRVLQSLGVVTAGLISLAWVAGCGGDETVTLPTAAASMPAQLTLADLPVEDREGIVAAMRVARPVDGGTELQFHDHVEQVAVTIGEASSVIEGRDGAAVMFSDASIGREDSLVPLSGAAPDGVATSTVSLDRAAGAVQVEEWWQHGAAGIQQGFTVRSRPVGTGQLRLQQTVSSTLTAEIVEGGRGTAFFDGDGERLRFGGLVAFDATGRHLPATMGLDADRLVFDVDDTDAVFPVVIDPVWSQQAYLKASNTDAGDWFGFSVAVSGDTVVVGGFAEKSSATGVDGDQANNSLTNAGAAYVFVRSGGVWSQQAYLKASNTGDLDQFARSVAVSGDTIVVGAPDEDSNATGVNGDGTDNTTGNSGAAYVFVRSGGVWSQQAYLKASNTGNGDRFGSAVAVSGDTAVVGAYLEASSTTGVDGDGTSNAMSSSGAAYVFVRSGGVWSQQAYLKASNTGNGDFFGVAVGVSGDTVVVGAPREDSNATGANGDGTDNTLSDSGAVYVFVRSGGVWSQQAYLKASNGGNGDWFGNSVGVSGDTVVVGAPREDSNAVGVNADETDNSLTSAGSAYVFVRSAGVWSQQAYLKASNTGAGDQFGAAVGLSADTIIVGAFEEDGSATGENGDDTDNSAAEAGAVYVFVRSGGVWSQQSYLKASNTEAGDRYGYAVAVSDGTVVVGEHNEDSNATGVNGDETDNAAVSAGAAFVWSSGLVVAPPAPVVQPPAVALPPGISDLVTRPVATTPSTTTTPTTTTPTTTTPTTTTPTTTTPTTTVAVAAPAAPTAVLDQAPPPGTAMVVMPDGTVAASEVAMTSMGGKSIVSITNPDGTELTLEHDVSQSLSDFTVYRGGAITVAGEGYQPNAAIDVWLRSSPVLLGSTVATADGTFAFEVTVPTEVEPGSHTLHIESEVASVVQATSLGLLVADRSEDVLPATGVSPNLTLALLVTAAGMVLLLTAVRRRSRVRP